MRSNEMRLKNVKGAIRRTSWTGRLAVVFVAFGLVAGAVCLAAPAFAAAGKAEAAPESGKAPATGKVNLNTATAEELQELPGVGPALAQRILDYRKENGSFKKVEELMNVKGIGEKSFQKLKDRLTVSS